MIGAKSPPTRPVPTPIDAGLEGPCTPLPSSPSELLSPLPALPMPALPLPPSTHAPSTVDTRPEWARAQKLSPDEWQALIAAGLDPTQLDTLDQWPLPDSTARQIQALPTAPGSGRSPPEGWTEISVQPSSGAIQHYWFMPVDQTKDLRRLQQGQFLANLAEALGVPAVVPAVHAHFHRVSGQACYGMLVPALPYAHNVCDTGLDSQRPDMVTQCVALDWLAYLMGQPIHPGQVMSHRQGDDFQLGLKLPLEPVHRSSMRDREGPARPYVMDQAMVTRCRDLIEPCWADRADKVLGDTGFAQRLRRTCSAPEEGVPVRQAHEPWGEVLRQSNPECHAVPSQLDKVKTGKLTADDVRGHAGRDCLVARIELEWGLKTLAESRESTIRPPRESGSSRHKKGKSKGKAMLLTPISALSIRKGLKLDEGTASSPRAVPNPLTLVNNDPQWLHTYKLYNTLKPLEETLSANRQSPDAVDAALADAAIQSMALVRQLDQAQARANLDAQPLPADLTAWRNRAKIDAVRIEQASQLWHMLMMQGAIMPPGGWSVQLLMEIVAAGLRPDDIVPALHAGATAAEILQARQMCLPPSWPSLARSMQQHIAQGQTDGAQPQREQHNWAQLAQAAHERQQQTVVSPRSSRIGTARVPSGVAGPPMKFAQRLGLSTATLWTPNRLEKAIAAASAFDAARAALASTPLHDVGSLSERQKAARTACEQLAQALDHLSTAFDPSQDPRAHELMSELLDHTSQQLQQLQQLSTLADGVRPRLPKRLTRPVTAEDLLSLPTQQGPELDFVVHGLLVGWTPHDITAAHRAGWPSWMMEWGSTFADAKSRQPVAEAGMKKVMEGLQPPR